MRNQEQDRYEILRGLTAAGSGDVQLEQIGRTALEQTADLIGLDAISLYLWDDQHQITLQLTHSQSDSQAARLASLEDSLFEGLRREHQLESAYMSFGGDEPCHSFTLPLRRGRNVFGAVIGLQYGERRTIPENDFLDALTGTLALHAMASSLGGTPTKDQIDKERFAAVMETAVTVNDKINNALQAIIGTVQLLTIHREDLDDELRSQLGVIEKSATRIKRVTQGLLRLTSAKTIEYTPGTQMIELPDLDDDSDDTEPTS
jgi:signal transduction histidine kinase